MIAQSHKGFRASLRDRVAHTPRHRNQQPNRGIPTGVDPATRLAAVQASVKTKHQQPQGIKTMTAPDPPTDAQRRAANALREAFGPRTRDTEDDSPKAVAVKALQEYIKRGTSGV